MNPGDLIRVMGPTSLLETVSRSNPRRGAEIKDGGEVCLVLETRIEGDGYPWYRVLTGSSSIGWIGSLLTEAISETG